MNDTDEQQGGDRGWRQRMNTLTARRAEAPRPRVPAGQRVYAIGDVHGRLDLLLPLLAHIRDDSAARADADSHVVLLGDLVDRGPYSAETVEYAISGLPSFATFHILMGNHEEAMLRALDPLEDRATNLWLKFGGYETLASYGMPVAQLGEELPPAETLRHYIPERHRQFLDSLPDALVDPQEGHSPYVSGSHAGRPLPDGLVVRVACGRGPHGWTRSHGLEQLPLLATFPIFEAWIPKRGTTEALNTTISL